MTQQLSTTAIIRQRGQLTIPDSIRGKVKWANPGSVVTVSQVNPDEIVIKPQSTQKKVVADDLWRRIRLVRSFKGKGKPVRLSEFVVKDRESHL